jgi:hypothetical protein
VINGWRTKEFPSEPKQYELEVARMFCQALDEDLVAHPTTNEPFDVEVISCSQNRVVAGVQLVEAYDDARRARDAERRRAIEGLVADEVFAARADGWQLIVQTPTALEAGARINAVDYQLDLIRSMLGTADWSRDEFRVSAESVVVAGRRRGKAGVLSYVWRGGLLPVPGKSPFLRAAETKLSKHYSRPQAPPFWLLIYSLSLVPDAHDCLECCALLTGRDGPFDDVFLFDVMGARVARPLSESITDAPNPESEDGFSFQLDPSAVQIEGAVEEFVEVKLPRAHR